ncbi:DUF817 domain-containing protein [Amylibacter marinus]|nr:DUF817 domain-containing protein [Amylibacter marinus]
MRAKLPHRLSEFIMFGLKQAWACLFGAILLIAIILSAIFWQDDWALSRYDALFIFALAMQIFLLVSKLESKNEAKVIFLFHITGTVMEVFKLHMGSWDYPDQGFFEIAGVPLFSGFMYASVGSYIARVIRVFDMKFAPYPPFWMSVVLASAIYGNFFWHHFWVDIRIALFVATVVIFARTKIWFYIGPRAYWMPMPLAAFFAAFFLWLAENIGTVTGTWIYAGQSQFELVRLGKLGSWYLLLYISFLLVTLVYRQVLLPSTYTPKR